jgi:hypothetical protein
VDLFGADYLSTEIGSDHKEKSLYETGHITYFGFKFF